MNFLWYDLETFGRDPRRSRIAQFAALRTDEDLREIEAPVSLFCKPAGDLLPSPLAALVTGISPQRAEREGLVEAELFARIAELMAVPGTCSLGYNSLRFDDEFIRFGLYRNFFDPYEREWRHGNRRWDLLDVLRLAHALRPEGLVWPKREDGHTSFRLEDLATANGVREGMAHEALSDVRALVALARRLREAQPRLWDYALTLRDKHAVLALCDVAGHTPLLHVSGRFPAERRHAALVAPLTFHPALPGRVLAYDLDTDPRHFEALDETELATRLYTPRSALPEGQPRLPLKAIHANRCPVLLPLAHVRPAELAALGLDARLAAERAAWLSTHPGFVARLVDVMAAERPFPPGDADGALYDGFPPEADKRLFPRIRSAAPADLPGLATRLTDPRYRELLFRYQARNWPESLDPAQREAWDAWRRERFADPEGQEGSLAAFRSELAEARARAATAEAQALLDALEDWTRARCAEVGLVPG
ncbi:exodeoxyribonuclease I [Silanimonas lenta]|uniref:exodeoxyribonuclease I n=1 Tax=Silanimonas lenta TaxID=265429 RepID=UPI000411B32A|nr:exodeoxyribonuclease I [Silanimonas lenta]